jgi:hypothetical protein
MWRDVEQYEGLYRVSDTGDVLSVARTAKSAYGSTRPIRERLLKLTKNSGGYLKISLHKEGKAKEWRVHVLVAKAFVPNPDKFPQVNHIDGNKLNNRATNLEWSTQRHNTIHAYNHGLILPSHGTSHWSAKLTEADVSNVIQLRKDGLRYKTIAERLSIKEWTVRRIIKGKSWKRTTGLPVDAVNGNLGEGNAFSTLKDSQVKAMIEMRESGKMLAEIAVAFQCSMATVSRICSGKTWSSVTGIKRFKGEENEES